MCELVHGTPPQAHYEALHTCGNGHIGCMNPTHLRWGTSKQNKADAITHGTMCRGESKPNAKLTQDDVRMVRDLMEQGVSQWQIGRRFGVSQQTICDIKHRRLWGWL